MKPTFQAGFCSFFAVQTISLLLSGNIARAEGVLSLDDFLSQVRTQNTGVKGSLTSAAAGELRSEEGGVQFAPSAFFNASFSQDGKIQSGSFLGYDAALLRNYSFGFTDTTRFGLQAKLHYDVTSQDYTNPNLLFNIPGLVAGPGSPFIFQSAYASPVLELTQSLWSNGFGSSTQAQEKQQDAQAMFSSYNARYASKNTLSDSEKAYWRLASARQTIAVEVQALDRAQKIYEWNSRRARLELTDKSDVLQSDANLQSRQLELLTAKNEERSASRAFNSARNIDSDHVAETLVQPEAQQVSKLQPPQRAKLRDDVKAAEQNSKSTLAGAEVSRQKNMPTLEVFANFTLNGQPAPSYGNISSYVPYANVSDAVNASFTFNRPTETFGVRFSIPLDLSLMAKTREGWAQESIAAEYTYDRKLFEQEQDWKDWNESLNESKDQLDLSIKIEKIQEAKLSNEKDRLHRGRTTTYQVLLFEQDYLLAQLTRIKNQVNVLNIIAKMKTFGETL